MNFYELFWEHQAGHSADWIFHVDGGWCDPVTGASYFTASYRQEGPAFLTI